MRRFFTKQKPPLPLPMICIGNAVLGGAGKTPVTKQLAQAYLETGKNPHIILKGYGGRISVTTRVTIDQHSWTDVGDEAYLYAVNGLPTWIGKDRYATALAAHKAGADVLLFDDGLQDFSMPYTKRLLVIDKSFGVGNACLFPAGPLREPLPHLLHRIDGIIGLGYEESPFPNELLWFAGGNRVLCIPPDVFKSPVVAFAGIGNPLQFFDALTSNDLDLKATHSFPDHYPYSNQDITDLLKTARFYNARLVTTEKDFYRLPSSAQGHVTPIYLQLSLNTARLLTALES